MQDQKFDITGMTCSACSAHVEKSVRKLDGIQAVSVNLLTNSMQVEYDESVLNERQIIDAVVKAGYGASLRTEHQPGDTRSVVKASQGENPAEAEQKQMKFRQHMLIQREAIMSGVC